MGGEERIVKECCEGQHETKRGRSKEKQKIVGVG